jgi:hypothetical protein
MASQDESAAQQQLAAAHAAHRNDPDRVLADLNTRLASGSQAAPTGSFKTGGRVPKDGTYKLHKGETVMPVDRTQDPQQSSQPQPDDNAQQPAPAGAASDSDSDTGASTEAEDEAIAGKVNLMKLYSKMNVAVTDLFDSLGVRRSLTLPHQNGQDMASHITDVGQAIQAVGGITANMITATHTKHDPKGGATVAHPSEQLRQTIIPKNFLLAQKAVDACRTLVNKIASLVPDETPEVLRAKSVVALLDRHDMAGMSAFDAGVTLIAVTHPLFKLLARQHSFVKHGPTGHPRLTAPQQQ